MEDPAWRWRRATNACAGAVLVERAVKVKQFI